MLELGRRRRAPLERRARDRRADRGIHRLGDQHGLRPQPDPPGRAEGAAGDSPAGGDHRAVHRRGVGRASAASAGLAVYHAKKWKASPAVRLALGGAATVVTALIARAHRGPVGRRPARAAAPSCGPRRVNALPLTLLAVCLLRAVATTAAVAAGGCGGVFVPFLAIGDLAGRVFAPGLGVGNDLAGAAGAAGGIAGGYRLPFTAAAMVLGVGGPPGDADLSGHRRHRHPRRRGRRDGAREAEGARARRPARPRALSCARYRRRLRVSLIEKSSR